MSPGCEPPGDKESAPRQEEASRAPAPQWQVEPAQPSDVETVAIIDSLSFNRRTGAASILDEMERAWARVEVLRTAPGAAPVAFVDYWLVADEVHILTLATHPEARGRGYGGHLLQDLLTRCRARGFRLATLEVRRSNGSALRLYERAGFRTVGVRPGYYEDNQEDALVMDLLLPSTL